MVRVSVEELVSRVLPELYALTSIQQYPARALSLVRRLIGGDKADYTEVDLLSGSFRVLVDPEPPQLTDLAAARRAYTHEHPVLAHFLSSTSPDSRLISDFLTPREFHRLGLYGDFFALLGVEDQLTVTVTPPSSQLAAGVSIDRDRRSFDDRDRRLMESLRPHLVTARTNAARFSQALTTRSQPTNPTMLDRLTPRQHEILEQVAAGQTNAQIALTLDLSAGTVRKHLEHILQRLNVHTRTTAAVLYLTAADHAADQAPTTSWTAALRLPRPPAPQSPS